MKNKVYAILTALLFGCFFLSGCASTSGSKTGKGDDFVEPPLFADWQYKGFGQEYPQWAEDALKEESSSTVEIQFGENLDMLIPHEYEEAEENAVKQIWGYIDPYYDNYEERYVYVRILEE